MSKSCLGCGAIFQMEEELKEGYTTNFDNEYCLRCFKMRNYGSMEISTKSNEEYINILKEIGKEKDLVLYLVDLLNIPSNLNEIRKYLKETRIILVINKRDALPLSVNDEKLLDYFEKVGLDFTDIVLISAKNNHNLDILFETILERKISDKVYIAGNTNAGKSTLIDKLMKHYAKKDSKITISMMPGATLNKIEIPFLDFTLIDTPGLFPSGNILNFLNSDEIKKISVKKEIKPITYQAKIDESFIIDNILRLDYNKGSKNSFTFFISNDLMIKRIHSKKNISLKDMKSREVIVKANEDVCINGLGFIKITNAATLTIYVNEETEIFTRKSLI